MLKLCALVFAAGCWCSAAQGVPFDRAYWIAVSSGVVKIEVSRDNGYSIGTGVVVERGKVVTACHVVRAATKVAVLHAGVRHNAVSRTISAAHDICILDAPLLDAQPAVLRPTTELAIGEEVGAMGFSAGNGIHYAHGAVERLHPYDGSVVVQGAAAFTSGASGGGLFDADRRLVGILLFRMRSTGAQFFSAPVEWIRDVPARGRDAAEEAAISVEPFWNRAFEGLPWFMRANILVSAGRWDEVPALLSLWQHDEPLSAEPAFLAGELDSHRNDMQQALIDYREAVTRDPAHALAWCGLLRASVKARMTDSARQAYSKLVSLSSVLSSRMANEFPEVLQ
jgi:serine protease Do